MNTDQTTARAVKSPVKKRGEHLSNHKLDVLITIVNRRKADYFADLIQSFEVNMQLLCSAEGTLKSLSLDRLELVATPKMVILSVIKHENAKTILETLDDRFKTIRDGEGISFSVPMSSIIGKMVYGFLSNQESLAGGKNYG